MSKSHKQAHQQPYSTGTTMVERTKKLSAYVICFNEEDMIEACLLSLNGCDEIIVVDSFSSDRTVEIIKSLIGRGLPIQLFQNKWPGYAKQKQFALEKCTGEWCLCLDADERLDPELAAQLPRLTASADINGWYLEYLPFLYGYGYPPKAVNKTALLRLVRNGKAYYDQTVLVHEKVIIDGKIERCMTGRILHRRSLPLGEQILKENTYSSLKARQLFEAGKKPRYLKLMLNPFAYFLKAFFLRKYLYCGWAGFVHAGTGAAYAFMTEAKLFQMHRKVREDELKSTDDVFTSQ